jgi:hypothetical protein
LIYGLAAARAGATAAAPSTLALADRFEAWLAVLQAWVAANSASGSV